MKQKRVLFWSTAISDLYDGKAYGIAVQLYFWARVFAQHGWGVTTLTRHKSFINENVSFKKVTYWGKFEIIHEWLNIFWKLVLLRPEIVISRGADRVAFPLVVLSQWLGVKYVFFGASDVNFEPGKELMIGGEHNRKLWQKAVCKMKHIVVQNLHQHNTLKENYGKNSIVLNNIWGSLNGCNGGAIVTDVIWVANFRPLKRPEWIVEVAKALPEVDITMIGGPSDDKQYYEIVYKSAEGLPNLHFLGAKRIDETNALISQARILCCTSIFEGFPNTFLQAWSAGIPVVSTVDPSGIIVNNNLGEVVGGYEEFMQAVQKLLLDKQLYIAKCTNVKQYFELNHSADIIFMRLMEYIGIA